MSRVLALVEGQTERTFVQEVLAPGLSALNVHMHPRVIGKPGHKGGVGEFARARVEIIALLKQEPHAYCTTMFDYYGMPESWPGISSAKGRAYTEIPSIIETAITDEIVRAMGTSFNRSRFIAHLQMHEFEALLFSEPTILADAVGHPELAGHFQSVIDGCGACEAIDDGPTTAPPKRIMQVVPAYEKVLFGSIAAKRIGLQRMRENCPHFAQWVTRLESLAAGGS